jgi:cellulose synthase/poly-beta-1,6-N-acetylglucosamine synthase-like glycosyltransferase
VSYWLSSARDLLDVVLVYYFFLLNAGYLTLSILAFGEVHKHLIRSIYGGYEQLSRSPLTPSISVIVPAYNEEVSLSLTVNNLLHLDYMRYEVIVVNDGSTDGTMEELKEAFSLKQVQLAEEDPSKLPTAKIKAVYRSETNHMLTVIDKENGGKADALNAGLNHSLHPYFCSVDADVIMEPDALQRVVQPIMESDRRVAAVGGIIRVANGCRVEKGRLVEVNLSRNPLAIFQVIEYFRAFLCGRTGFSRFNGLMIISGAFGVFEKDLVVAIGGYRRDTVGEDMDIVTRLHLYLRESGLKDYLIAFVPDPVCWTEAPSTLRVLARQRRRWQKGLLEVLAAADRAFLNPKYGVVGMVTYPFLLVFEGWGVILELAGYVAFFWLWWRGAIETDFMIAFFWVAFFCGAALSLCGVLLGEMTPRRYPKARHWVILIAFAFIENLGYRQLTTALRLLGIADYLRGSGTWGRMERTGLGIFRRRKTA